MARWTLLFAALLLSACDSLTGPGDLPALRTDAATYRYETRTVGEEELLEVVIPYRYTNRTDGPVFLLHCNRQFGQWLERRVGERWVTAWATVQQACLSPPIVLFPGKSFSGALFVREAPQGGFPNFDTNPTGTFRIVWPGILSSFDEDRPNLDTELPVEHRVSNTFTLEVPVGASRVASPWAPSHALRARSGLERIRNICYLKT